MIELSSVITKVSDEIKRTGFVGKVTRVSAEKLANEYFSNKRIDEQVQILRRFVSLENKKILEVGSGYGYFVVRGRSHYGFETWGIEPSLDPLFDSTFAISQELLRQAGLPSHLIQNSTGEALPFPDESFDIVYSSNVLEHVQSPEKVIHEAIRVLKPNGVMQFVVPNYGSWWEGHYGIIWIPNISLCLARYYVRLFRRDPAFLNTLQFVNHRTIKKAIEGLGSKIEVLDWGTDIWIDRLKTMNFSDWSSLKQLKILVNIMHDLKLINLLIWIGRTLHWETPIILTLRKK